jgi:hypothetical protein
MDDQTKHVAASLIRLITQNSGYHARQEIERLRSGCRADSKRLEPFGFKVYSQNDEDGIIEEIFRRLGIATGSFLEIGVENGLECNSLYLLHRGWRGVWIEGDQAKHEGAIRAKFTSLAQSRRLTVLFAYVTPDNINPLLEHPSHGFGEFDFLSIDIDGNDIHLLRALQSRPKVICIEYNGKWPPHVRKVPTYDPNYRWTGTDYMGSSLAALNDVAVDKGYRLVATNITGANAFFVRADLAGALFCDDATPQNLYNPLRLWLLFDHFKTNGFPSDFGPYEDLVG